jgi:hypothetical protein
LARERLQLKRSQWYTLRVTFQGNEATALIGGVTAKASHPVLGEPKEQLHLLVFEGDAAFRNLTAVK